MKTWTNIGMVNQEMARDMTAAVWDSEEFRDRAGRSSTGRNRLRDRSPDRNPWIGE